MDDSDGSALSALRSIAHPVRLRILSLLTAEAMSAAEVARALKLTHANASYHLRLLLDAGELVVESEEKIRGGRAKRYRYPIGGNPARAPSHLSRVEDHIAWQHATNSEVVRRLAHMASGPESSSDIETWVAPDVWRAAIIAISSAMVALHEAARPPGTEDTIHVSASSLAFVMDDDA